MRRIVTLLLAVGLVAGMGFAAAPAGASVAEKPSRYCKALKNFDLPELSNSTTEQEAAATAKQLRKLARKATGSTKQAIKTLATGFQEIADGSSPSDVLNTEYAKAAATFAVSALKCVTTNISLPDITLPGQ